MPLLTSAGSRHQEERSHPQFRFEPISGSADCPGNGPSAAATALTNTLELKQGGTGFLVFVPIYVGERFDGYIGGVFQIQSLTQ
ncbi:MAG: hypothetical protein HC899_27300, partial [Leptolyngbyaceae cyanobacterium SM1_4_3]|nr:hypothetical protein [Leptolyngbyaceae cyanobacterium SM1_4_3]